MKVGDDKRGEIRHVSSEAAMMAELLNHEGGFGLRYGDKMLEGPQDGRRGI
eukprot:CAMPEP_0174939252 /NCGR_PEP_ID=MMETSP1355-20121228/65975_1 /TAXON_ID=464990 /ORGANISM="Hemiselmis tepida, Strain CCMP443" /LENGTH=50 /DNA_ID=CAMNT_0016186255 /DNA_START=215 /DNA_END=367 /DNA_ORIENTATION=-